MLTGLLTVDTGVAPGGLAPKPKPLSLAKRTNELTKPMWVEGTPFSVKGCSVAPPLEYGSALKGFGGIYLILKALMQSVQQSSETHRLKIVLRVVLVQLGMDLAMPRKHVYSSIPSYRLL